MNYVLVIWVIAHMHVEEVHPHHLGAEFFPSLQACMQVGEMLTSAPIGWRHAHYRCELQL
jgi:hypothetical protein